VERGHPEGPSVVVRSRAIIETCGVETGALSFAAELPPDATRELVELARLSDGGTEPIEELLRRGLEWLGRVAPYDLAVVFELRGGELWPRALRGELASPRVKEHRLSLSAFPAIRSLIQEGRARAFTEEDHAHGDGDPFDGLLDLPHGHACMVVPLVSGGSTLGVMTLDRQECMPYPEAVVDLVEVYGRLLALTIRLAEKSLLLSRASAESAERAADLDGRLAALAEDSGVLETSRNARVRELARRAAQVAETSTPVLLLGETGTGKERLARGIHAASRRRERPFVPVNCAAIPGGVLESELFGHERGAFTGAARARAGLFRTADGGTLFLDEIGELPLELQAKLLRVLQSGELMPVGGDRSERVNVRLIAATHVDLEAAVKKGRFREDLYYRISVFPLRLVPLRERLEDLPELCERLLAEIAQRTGRRHVRVSPEGLSTLRFCAWQGNIRELSNVLERASILSERGVLGPAELGMTAPLEEKRPPSPGWFAGPAVEESEAGEELLSLEDNERRHIERVLRVTAGRIYGDGGAAKILGVPPTTLQSKVKRLGIRGRTG
jgi:formate hydrogenlyase transcriptional activator